MALQGEDELCKCQYIKLFKFYKIIVCQLYYPWPGQEWCKVRLREGPAQPKYRPRPQWLSNSQQCLCLGLAWSARRQTTNTSRKLRGTLLREKKPLESEYIIKYENPFFVFDNLRINHMYILYKLSIISRIYI